MRALAIIRDHPGIAYPGRFADLFWPEDWTSPVTGYRLHAQRNHASAPMASWWAAGYLGRLRKAGYIDGGDYGDRQSGYVRHALRLTQKGRDVLQSVSEPGLNAVGGR